MKRSGLFTLVLMFSFSSLCQENNLRLKSERFIYNQEFKRAVSLTDSILEADTTATWAWNLKGRAEMGLLRYRDALTSFRKAGSYSPDSIPVLTGMGNASYVTKDWIKAYDNYRESYALDPGDPALLYSMGVLCEQHLNDKPKALQYYNLLIKQSKLDKETLENWGEAKIVPLPVLAWRRKKNLREEMHFEGKIER
ncbi:MAG: hypothetical protein GXO83_01940 [Chlorobi bacterium]|nr:hypothetical protein [Chlorobiota bacterium]